MSERRFVVATMTGVVALGVLHLVVHEPWTDEWQAWLIARDSESLWAMLQAVRYEVHPPLWHLLLYPLSRLTRDILAMRLLHLLLGVLSTYVVVRYAPFGRVTRLLYAFSYFAAFEYFAISRPYVLMGLLLFSYCAVTARAGRSLVRGALLAALALTTVYGLILAAACGLGWIWSERHNIRAAVAGTAVAAVGGLLAIISLLPPADASPEPGLRGRGEGLGRLPHIADGWVSLVVPIPYPKRRFWGTTVVDVVADSNVLNLLIVVVAVAAVTFALRRNTTALLTWLGGLLAILALSYWHFIGTLRHQGSLVLLALAAAWLCASHRQLGRRAEQGLQVFLAVSVVGAAWATVNDIRYSFSGTEAASEFLEEQADVTIAADPDLAGVGIAGRLDIELYQPKAERTATYVTWDERRRCTDPCRWTPQELRRRLEVLAASTGEPVILVAMIDFEIHDTAPAGFSMEGFTKIASFQDNVVDNLYLYTIDPGASSG